MAEGGADPAGHDRQQEMVRRLYDPPTTPMPVVRPEDLAAARDAVSAAGAEDPVAASLTAPIPAIVPAERPSPGAPSVRLAQERTPPFRSLGRRIADLPIRVVYTIAAALATVVAVVLIFLLFSGDRPEDTATAPRSAAVPAASAAATPAPSPSAAPSLPKVPASREMPVFPGAGTVVASYVLDRKSGISYAKFGAPWTDGGLTPFAQSQQAGEGDAAPAVIGSLPLPGAAPGTLATYADYRRAATRAARWTLRQQPPGAVVSWTASRPVRRGMGWLLGYKATYRVGRDKHSAQAFVMVVGTGGKRPAVLFASVPDDRKELYRDLNMLFWTLSPI